METDKSRLKGPQQILNSKGNINAKKRATYEEITDIKFKNEKHEKDRRDLDDFQREQRFQTLQAEAIESSKQNAALEMRWAALQEIDEYETLLKSINEQKQVFDKILDSKNGMIALFKENLKKKDDDYRKILKEQNEDIDQIIARMRNQFYGLRSMYLSELNEIEHKYDQDRGDLLKSNKADIDKKSNRHAEMEKKIVEDREATEKRNMDEIDKLRIDYAKSYADKKISMETEIQNLEKCFEDMKALYLLNIEKLGYNFKVLKEKDEENTILANILKKKKSKLFKPFDKSQERL
jgi:dynein regulatory complex protein 1